MIIEKIALAIFVGGKSRRMGRDKATILWKNKTFIEHIADSARAADLPIYLIGREKMSVVPDARGIPDDIPQLGPIGGLLTALRVHNDPIIAVACDTPHLSVDAFNWLIYSWYQKKKPKAVITTTNRQIQPLFSLYTPALQPKIEQQIATNRRSLLALIKKERLLQIKIPEQFVSEVFGYNDPLSLFHLSS